MPDLEQIALVAAIVGFAAWIVTNLHLILQAKAIRKASDDRWKEVQTEVDDRLGSLKKAIDEALVSMDSKVETVKSSVSSMEPDSLAQRVLREIDPRLEGLKRELEEVYASIKGTLLGFKGNMGKFLVAAGEDALEAAGSQVADAAGLKDPTKRALMKLKGLKVNPEWEAEHPYAAAGLDVIRELAIGTIEGELGASSGTSYSSRGGAARKPSWAK